MSDEPGQDKVAPSRRALLGAGAAAAGAGLALAASCAPESQPLRLPEFGRSRGTAGDWNWVRRQFVLTPERVHMSAMLITSHPRPVRAAIGRHRDALDADPADYLEANNTRLTRESIGAAADYLDVGADQIALTDSTTMGVGLVYSGLALRAGQEILTTDQDYFVTHEAVRLACIRTGAVQRRISLHEDSRTVTAQQIVDRIAQALRPQTRVLGLTWVHSSTGLKMPLREIGEAVEAANRGRDEDDRVLVVVDGVHGFGNQDVDFDELGCDFLAAGCHKWLFGPRGTGVVAGSRRGYEALVPGVPSFLDEAVWAAWLEGREPSGGVDGRTLTPGGFKPFEHQWALAEAFAFHREIGRGRVAERTAELAGQLKEGLAGIRGVTLRTPRSSDLSAGIVSFDIDGLDAQGAVNRLRDRGIVASAAPYAVQHVRLTPSIRNSPQEVERALREVHALAA